MSVDYIQRREDLTTPCNINDVRACIIHERLGEMIALDGRPIIVSSLAIRFPAENTYLTDNLFPRIITGVKAELN